MLQEPTFGHEPMPVRLVSSAAMATSRDVLWELHNSQQLSNTHTETDTIPTELLISVYNRIKMAAPVPNPISRFLLV